MTFQDIPKGEAIRLYSAFGAGRKYLGMGVLHSIVISTQGAVTYRGVQRGPDITDPLAPWNPDPGEWDCMQSASGEYVAFRKAKVRP